MKTCSICGDGFTGFGNNPAPVKDYTEDGVCCDDCNASVVLPARFGLLLQALGEGGAK